DGEVAAGNQAAEAGIHGLVVHQRAVAGTQILHVHAAILLQCQQHMLRRREGILDGEVAAHAAADAALPADTADALAQLHVPVIIQHFHQHHGLHCIAPRKRRTNCMPGSNPTPRRSSWLTTARSMLLMLVTVTAMSYRPVNSRYCRTQVLTRASKPSS